MQFSRQAIAFLMAFLSASLLYAGIAPTVEDPLTNPGFVHFYNNEFDQAVAWFEQELKTHSDSPELYNHVAQGILYREMLRDGALESQLVSGNNPFLRRPKMEISAADKARFDTCIDQTLKLTSAALAKDPHDIAALYAQGVAHGLRANYLFLVEKAWVEALREATAARKADQEIVSIDPSFIDARLLLGLNQYVVGALPFYMRALGFLGGFHGDKEAGIRELELVAKSGVMNRYDAEVLLAAIYRRERKAQQAIPLLKDLAERFPRNYLLRFEQVQMYSDLGNKNSALQVLAEIDDLRTRGAPGYADLPLEKIKYLKGNLLFWYGDLDPALTDLKEATRNADKLDLNTAVLAWLRIGQTYDLQGNHQQAIGAYRETMKTAPKSQAATEASTYISNPYRRKRSTG
ncbi:MAG: tetratricopeptide repeat protein [Acidobacteriaceae bacterium]|nr:tetratricopeptide repeat protein [Acidobacteriaceae bacterium]MBV9764803.1 tetratricopeptide repeat protein [Acidobacteriaceae bacterium]